MNNENAHAHRNYRIFVLSILGIVVITFLLVVWFFHVPVGKHRAISTTAPALDSHHRMIQRRKNGEVCKMGDLALKDSERPRPAYAGID